MAHGDIISFVERPRARYGKTIDEANAERLLSDPIEFSQNYARFIALGALDHLLIEDVPKQIDDLMGELEFMVETAHHRRDIEAAKKVFATYTECVSSALGDAREYGVALGAVMEQLRTGIERVVDLSHQGLTQGDVSTLNAIQRLRREYDIKPTSGYKHTDLAKAEEDEAREEAK